ncbi:MAG: uracil-DNA glycosylase [Deltaproteobacteria bacterium]|nr:uracil-DNA glycosylase [Deltaproteobacteria bacterium]
MTKKLYHECHELISQGRAILTDLQHWGFESVPPLSAFSPLPLGQPEPVGVSQKSPGTLENLASQIQGCTLCPLSAERKNIVFGAGNPQADLVLVGEAPGREEDETGVPFVGEAGRLLEKILFAMQLSREAVYICNVIKCRPPHNRDPQADEIACCEPFLKQQLSVIKPQVIITLGRFATQTLLHTKDPISRVRGHWHEYEGIPLMPTFHPAYLLRSPAGKRDVWEDMKQVL